MVKNDLSLQITAISEENFFDDCGILCVINGNLTVTCESGVYKLNKGNAAFFAPDEFYYINNKTDAEYIFISFNATGELLSDLSGLAVEVTEAEMLLLQEINTLVDLFDDSASKQQIFSMLELFLLLCLKKESVSSCEDKNAILFSKAVEILKRNIDSNVSVSDLADRLNISVSNLKRLFAKYTNIGVHEYYTFLKIAQAKELLSQGKTVTDTAELTGFANQAYFSAAFKRITGKTPKEYAFTKTAPVQKKTQRKVKSKKDMPSYLL